MGNQDILGDKEKLSLSTLGNQSLRSFLLCDWLLLATDALYIDIGYYNALGLVTLSTRGPL